MDLRRLPIETVVALAHSLIVAQFPQWAHLPLRPVGAQGNDNRTFRLGAAMSVRLPSAEGYAAAVEKEHIWLPRLAPNLPLAIPEPVALGEPGEGYPWRWSINRWLEGEDASNSRVSNLVSFSRTLAGFLLALHAADAEEGPPAGAHSFFRGAPLDVYDKETRTALTRLGDKIDVSVATEVWECALSSTWSSTPVWFHGDIVSMNLLLKDGALASVLDFGCAGVGDPACDLAIAWTFLDSESRAAFRSALPLDAETWARGRGWALWKALIRLQRESAPSLWTRNPTTGMSVIDEVIADHLAEN